MAEYTNVKLIGLEKRKELGQNPVPVPPATWHTTNSTQIILR
jgi:hypothetical protein